MKNLSKKLTSVLYKPENHDFAKFQAHQIPEDKIVINFGL